MAKNLMPFKINRKKLIEQYARMVYKDDAYETTLLFNRIMNDANKTAVVEPVVSGDNLDTIQEKLASGLVSLIMNEDTAIRLRQVTVYGRLNAHGMEIDHLIKVLTDEKFCGYDAVAVLNRLATFFGFLMGIDVYDYYLEFLKNRFPNDERLRSVEKPLEKSLSKSLHFVDDEERSFKVALSKMASGDYHGAMAEIDTVSKISEKDFKMKNLEVAMLLSMGVEKPAREILQELEDAGCRDAEFYANLYQLSKINKEYISKTILMLEKEPGLKGSFELMVILASLYVMQGEHIKAVLKLNEVKGIKKDSREVLKLLAECYYVLKDDLKLVQVLKRIATLYPNDTWARFYLVNEDFDLRSNTNKFNARAVAQLKDYLLKRTKKDDAFENMDREEAFFLFRLLEDIKESRLAKDMMERIYHSKHRDILFDALISVHSDSVTLQLIFQVLIENLFEQEFFVLKDGKLEKYKFNIPTSLKVHEDKEKTKFLLTCYAQTYALVFYLGFDLAGVEQKLERCIDWLMEQDLLNNEFLFRDECVVYVLSNALFFNNEYIERTFKNLKKTEKQKLVEILESMKNN